MLLGNFVCGIADIGKNIAWWCEDMTNISAYGNLRDSRENTRVTHFFKSSLSKDKENTSVLVSSKKPITCI